MHPASPSPEQPLLLRRDEQGVAHLTLNRPAQFNALSMAMLDALIAALDAIARDETVRVVVLGGAGKAFCAGHDLRELRATPTQAFGQALFRQAARLMTRLTALPQPVIARVHGIATAAGCQLVSMCDLAVAAEEARFAVSGINVGLFCATPAVGLARNIGRKAAFEMLVTGDFIDAAEAQRRGLVNRVVTGAALDAEIARLSAAICAKPAGALRRGKQLFYQQLEMGVEAAYQLAAESMACNLASAEVAEGIDAFLAKRAPHWRER